MYGNLALAEYEVKKIMAEVDLNRSGNIDFTGKTYG